MISKHFNNQLKINSQRNSLLTKRHSIDQYSKLLNSMIVTKNQKKNKFQNLTIKFKQIKRQTTKKDVSFSTVKNTMNQESNFKDQFLKTQQKISIESKISNQLQQQLTRTKKSLNLLKGDLRHLVSRTQSTSLIESKTSKVKIVADQQLNRVYMAFLKDKDELKIKADMQKKFKRNLRNVSMIQNSALKKFRNNYAEMIMKKKEINERLNRIDKVSSLINQSGKIQKLKDENNIKVVEIYSCFLQLINLICQANGTQDKFLSLLLQSFQKINEINTERLTEIQDIIYNEYQRVIKLIQQKTIIYDLEMEKHHLLLQKLQSLNRQIQIQNEQYCHEVSLKFTISKQTNEQYNIVLKKFLKKLKILFVFLEFIQKFINFPQNLQKLKSKNFHNTSQFFVSRESSKNKTSFQYLNNDPISYQNIKQIKKSSTEHSITKNYVSELLIIYQIFKINDYHQNLDQINPDIFSSIQNDVQKWFRTIKQKQTNKNLLMVPKPQKEQKLQNSSKPRRSTSRLRQSRLSVFILPKTMKQLEDDQKIQIIEENKFHNQMHKLFQLKKRQNSVKQHRSFNSFHVWQRKNNQKSKKQLDKSCQDLIIPSKLVNEKKLKHVSEHLDQKQPKRFQLLQRIDRDYYKMLKQTLKMQIQNTKKNYIFTKDFKRDKYSPRIQILQQRRFQSNFSISFAKNSSKALRKTFTDTKKNWIFQNSNFQKRIQKLKDIKSSFQKIKPSEISNQRLSFLSHKEQKENLQNDKRSFKTSKSVILKRKFNKDLKLVLNLI